MREASWSFVPTAKCGLSRVGPCHHSSLRAPPPPRLAGLYSDLVCAAAAPAYANIWLASGAVSPNSNHFSHENAPGHFSGLYQRDEAPQMPFVHGVDPPICPAGVPAVPYLTAP